MMTCREYLMLCTTWMNLKQSRKTRVFWYSLLFHEFWSLKGCLRLLIISPTLLLITSMLRWGHILITNIKYLKIITLPISYRKTNSQVHYWKRMSFTSDVSTIVIRTYSREKQIIWNRTIGNVLVIIFRNSRALVFRNTTKSRKTRNLPA